MVQGSGCIPCLGLLISSPSWHGHNSFLGSAAVPLGGKHHHVLTTALPPSSASLQPTDARGFPSFGKAHLPPFCSQPTSRERN